MAWKRFFGFVFMAGMHWLPLKAQTQELDRTAMKAELERWMNEYRETLGTKEMEQLARKGDLFQAAVDVLRETERDMANTDYRFHSALHVISQLNDKRTRDVLFPYLSKPSRYKHHLSEALSTDPRWSNAVHYMIRNRDAEGERIIQGFLTDPDRDPNDKYSVLAYVEGYGGTHWIPYLKTYATTDSVKSDRRMLLTVQSKIKALERKKSSEKGTPTSSPLAAIESKKDYSDFCRKHPELIARIGDGSLEEPAHLRAREKLREMGVDLFDLLLWIEKNRSFVEKTCNPIQPYQPGGQTIPGILYRYGDKRALPYAKRYFEEQVQKGRQFDLRATRYLTALGMDDPESVRLLIDGMRRLDGKERFGFYLIEEILRRFPDDKPLPAVLSEAMRKSLEVGDETHPNYQSALLEYWKDILPHQPSEQELLTLIGLFGTKGIDVKRYTAVFVMGAFVRATLQDYPQKQPLPVSVLDRLDSLVRSDKMSRMPNEQLAAEWRAEKEVLMKALAERRRRDLGPR